MCRRGWCSGLKEKGETRIPSSSPGGPVSGTGAISVNRFRAGNVSLHPLWKGKV